MREQIQDSCSVDDGNVFDQGIGDSGCQNILVFLKKLDAMVTEIFIWQKLPLEIRVKVLNN